MLSFTRVMERWLPRATHNLSLVSIERAVSTCIPDSHNGVRSKLGSAVEDRSCFVKAKDCQNAEHESGTSSSRDLLRVMTLL